MQEGIYSNTSFPILSADADTLRHSTRCLCEIRDLDTNALVILGRIHSFNGQVLSICSANGRELRPVIYNTEYKLVLHIFGCQATSWHGQICGSTSLIWMFDALYCYHHMEQRESYRQPTNLQAQVLCARDFYLSRSAQASAAHTCHLIDVSLGGVQIEGNISVVVGDRIRIINLNLCGNSSFLLLKAVVCWTAQITPDMIRCGCAFQSLSSQDEDRLCAAILQMQRNIIAEQRS